MSEVEDVSELRVSRVFDASVRRVFDAWTQDGQLSSWFAPCGHSVVSTAVDLRVGGDYHIVIQAPEGGNVHHRGTYLEVVAPRRLCFTWILSGQACEGGPGEQAVTEVSIDFNPVGEGTAVELVHRKLPDADSIGNHRFGWNACMDSLRSHLGE